MGTYGQWKCDVEGCEKIFWARGKLEEHQRWHQGLPSENRCEECGKEFVYRSYLQRHWKKTGHEKGGKGKQRKKWGKKNSKGDGQVKREVAKQEICDDGGGC